ncbi:helix-turn-helix domain-containing protein [Nocardia sp. BMG51109]|uniref:helix-turn-helix domain-containing protein n=1 Tax=Nocardia sp. BMG51109 TaxID=1056816 RepID=UPI00046638BE|nr:helix-turn-helix transcriptional regulator [Nocardia sp. BMG51109]
MGVGNEGGVTPPNDLGRRLREIRAWRGQSLQVTADLAGISFGYLGKLERGDKHVDSRRLLEDLATALRVAPQELTGRPFPPTDPLTNEAHAAITGVEAALETYDLGEDPGVAVRPWPDVAEAVSTLTEQLRENADYAAMGHVLPGLLGELHAHYARDPERRRDVLVALIYAYRAAASVCKNLGVRGLPMMAVRAAHDCAQELNEPEWLGYAAYLRGIMGGPGARQRQYDLAVRAVDDLTATPGPNAIQVAGTLHFIAALACAVQGDTVRTYDHLAEADDLAQRLPEHHENFAGLYFGPDNVQLWRVSLATELGEGSKVAELAHGAHPDTIPLRAWQASFHGDLGRALATDRATRVHSVQSLVTAEQLAPQYVRNNVLIRETVTDLLPTASRDHTGRELRGLAHRMGMAPR